MNASGGTDPKLDDSDDRAPFAKSLDVAYQLMAVCAMFALPSVAGYFLDRWLGTVFLFSALGFVIGLAASIFHFMKMLRRFEADQTKEDDEHDREKKVT